MVYIAIALVVYLLVGAVLAFRIPDAKEFSTKENLKMMFLWLPSYIWTYIILRALFK